jgi:uncharacterized membrane protein YfhO
MPNKNYYKYTSENTIQYNKEFTDTVQNTLNSNQPIYRSNMTNYSTGLNIYNNVFSPNQFSDSIYTSINSQNWQNYHWQKLWTASKGVYPWVMPAADSPLADILQGVKYHFTTSSEDKNAITGYKYIAPHIYQNNSVFSIGYASNNIFSNINNMTDIEQTACLTQGIATQGVAVQKIDTKENIKESQTLPKTDHFETVDLANLAEQITQHNNSSRDNTKDNSENKKNISFEYNLPKQIENKPLFIKVNLQQNSQSSKIDSYLTINNVKNTIAYAKQQWLGYSDLHYVLSPDKNGAINKLTINLLPDHWNIKNIEAFTMPTNDLLNAYKYFDQMNVDSITTAGISGNINISHNNSVLAISTAWEPGFSLKIDGIQTPIFEANGGIIGSFINKGQHRIELEFHAPYYNAGLVISLATLVLLILLYLIKSLNKGFGRNKKYYNKKASKN